jgi:hypothetical protein
MLLYFYLLSATFLHEKMRPALAESWRRRSFDPCRELCAEVLARAARPVPEDSLLQPVVRGLPFAREFWHGLAGELLVHGCADMPLVQTSPSTLCCLLAPEQYHAGDVPRVAFAPIQQVHFGSRDLRFGGAFYRPEHAGYNDAADIARLLRYLEAIDPSAWHEAMLLSMSEFPTGEDRAEELAFVRDWWPPLVGMYRDADAEGHAVVCELV